jgi:hypothetical protein
MKPIDGKDLNFLQVAAGISLLRKSGLLSWDDGEARFTLEPEIPFEERAAAEDLLFGRLMKWMQFSAGFEFLVKGVLLLHGAFPKTSKLVLDIPKESESRTQGWWVSVGNGNATKAAKPSFGTLGTITHAEKDKSSLLKTFLQERVGFGISQDDCNQVLSACELLRDAIRNRDAHAYMPNVRKQQHALVHLLVPALNTLLRLAADDEMLRSHRAKAARIIALTTDDPFTQHNTQLELQVHTAHK